MRSFVGATWVRKVRQSDPSSQDSVGEARMGKPEERKAKDRDFIRTVEGMLFCVVGYLHLPDKYTAYLKYIPAPQGRWHKDKERYDRILARYNLSSVRDTVGHLEENYPHYIHYCPVRDMKFSMVPHGHVEGYYLPEERLREILTAPRDPLEEAAVQLALKVAKGAQIKVEDLGLTGSLLLGIHDPSFSDIDLTVFGLKNALRVKGFLSPFKGLSKPGGRGDSGAYGSELSSSMTAQAQIRGLNQEEMESFGRGIMATHPFLSPREARYFVHRRWNYLRFGGRYFSIHPTRKDGEIIEVYGDHIYRDKGTVRVKALVTDVSEALFSPAIYKVKDVEVIEGRTVDIQEIVSYEGLYAEVVDVNERVEAQGKVESIDGCGHRLVIGTTSLQGGGYLVPEDLRA